MELAIIGASGLIGTALTARLVAENRNVTALLRRSTGRSGPRYTERIGPVSAWPSLVNGVQPAVAVSALGTTIAVAGSQAAFEAIDLDAVIAFARAAHDAGARQMIAVSSVGADPDASNFYLRTKGRMEQALADIGFDRLDLFRPGLLLGKRPGPPRTGERIAIALSPLMRLLLRGPLDRYAPIAAETVAAAMAAVAGNPVSGVVVHEYRAIARRAARGA